MQFIENPDLDLSSTEYDREEVFNLIESTNPSGATLVLAVNDEIAHSPGLTWDVDAHFYLVESEPDATGEKSWVLFEISWDDNWGVWQRSVLQGIKGIADRDQAADLLLTEYWKSLNLDADDQTWGLVLAPFRKRAAKTHGL